MNIPIKDELFNHLPDRNEIITTPEESIWYKDENYSNFVFKAILNKHNPNNYFWQCYKRET